VYRAVSAGRVDELDVDAAEYFVICGRCGESFLPISILVITLGQGPQDSMFPAVESF